LKLFCNSSKKLSNSSKKEKKRRLRGKILQIEVKEEGEKSGTEVIRKKGKKLQNIKNKLLNIN
jgi:hypothetical protein